MNDFRWPLMKESISWWNKIKAAFFLASGQRLTKGGQTNKLEEAWSEWEGVSHSIYVNSGSSANLILMDAIKEFYHFPSGTEVLVPACTWVTNISPVIQVGFKPVFCDIDLQTLSFDLSAMRKIKESHPNIKIIFVTHLIGYPAPIDEFKKIFPESIILEDCCESHGAACNGEKVGSIGVASTFSFYYGHHMTTIEGGMICCNNPNLADLIKMKRSHGLSRESCRSWNYAQDYLHIDPRFLFMTLGYNFRSTDLQAYLGLLELPRLDGYIKQRNQNYLYFAEIITDSQKFYPLNLSDGISSFCLPFLCRNQIYKARLMKEIGRAGIETRPIIGGNLCLQPFLESYHLPEMPNANIVHCNGFYVGNNQFVTKKDIEWLGRIVKECEY